MINTRIPSRLFTIRRNLTDRCANLNHKQKQRSFALSGDGTVLNVRMDSFLATQLLTRLLESTATITISS